MGREKRATRREAQASGNGAHHARPARSTLVLAAWCLLLSLAALLGHAGSASATVVKGDDSPWGSLEIVPQSDAITDQAYLGDMPHVGFIGSMPATKRVRRVTIGNLAAGVSCSGSAVARLVVFSHPSGAQTLVWPEYAQQIAISASVVLPTDASQVAFDVPATTFQKGQAYSFKLDWAGGCQGFRLTTWAHDDVRVDGGATTCAGVPVLDVGMGGSPRRMWHEHGVNDRNANCIANAWAPHIFDPSMPDGWLVVINTSGWGVMTGSTTGALSDPNLCSFPYTPGPMQERGVEAVHWYSQQIDGVTHHSFVCRFKQYAEPGSSLEEGWFHGSPWLASRPGTPRDVYIGLNVEEPTPPEFRGLGPNGVSDYSAAPNLPHCQAGDPVNCATGNFAEGFTDLAVPGRGVGLKFARTYNSQAAEEATAPGPLGYGWSFSFGETLTEATDGTITVHHDDGSTATFTPTGNGGYTAPPWVQAKLVERTDGSFSYTLPDKRVMSFTSAGVLEWVEDRNANRTTLQYGGGSLSSITDPSGRSITLAYNADGRIEQVTDPAGHFVEFAYTGGELVTVIDAEGGETEFGYDSEHRITSVIDARGKELSNDYDAQGRVIAQTDPLQRTMTWDWSTPDQTRITDPEGNVTVKRFRALLPVSITRGVGTSDASTTTFRYDASGNLLERTNHAGETWSWTYDGQGNTLTATDPLEHTTGWTYDAARNVTSTTTPEGRLTEFDYDASGNLLSIEREHTETNAVAETTFDYDAQGQLESTTDPLDRTTTFDYNARGDLLGVTTPEGHTSSATYDIAGRQSSVTSARGNAPGADPSDFTTTYVRNAFGLPTDIQDPLGKHTLLEYDANQALVETTDRNSRTTTFVYDDAGQRIKTVRADLSELETEYDDAGRVVMETNGAGKATSYGYDALGRMTSVTDPLLRETEFTYDIAGNLATRKDPQNRTVSYDYDEADRLRSTVHSSGNPGNSRVNYNDDDQPIQISGGGTTEYTYDSLGRLTSHESTANRTTEYQYDLADQVTGLVYPDALTDSDSATSTAAQPVPTGTVTRGYDDDGNLVSVTDWLSNQSTFGYDSDGNLTSVVRPNGTSASYEHDANGALSELGELGTTTALGRSNTSMLSSSTPSGGSPSALNYDELERLTGVGSATFEYDDADNLTKLTVAGQAVSQAFDDASQLESTSQASVTTATFDYDASGNRVLRDNASGADVAYTYDQADRLVAYDGPNHAGSGTVHETYGYDAAGLRHRKTTGTQRRVFAYDVSGSLPVIITDGPTAYINGPDGLPIEQITQNGTVRYFHRDQLGSTRALSNAAGATVATYQYDAYGTLAGTPSSVENPFRFAGQYTDASSDLQYLRARYFDSVTGQFLTRDPLEDITGQPYAYANNNPANYTDPSGLIFGIPTPSLGEIGMAASTAAAGVLNGASFGYSTKLAGAAFGFDPECAEWGAGWGTGNVAGAGAISFGGAGALTTGARLVRGAVGSGSTRAERARLLIRSERGSVGGGGRLPVPPVPPGLNLSRFGKEVMRWGTRDASARARISTLTREELVDAGVTRGMAQQWADFYRNEILRNPANPSARGRADLMDAAARLLGG